MATRARGLPSIFVYTDSGTFTSIDSDKSHEEKGNIIVYDALGKLDYSGAVKYVKGHGNQTWLRDKKSYNIRLSRQAGLLGMTPSEKWALISNVMDRSNIRNSLVFEMSRLVGFGYTPSQSYVEVWLNGDYNGLYQLSEKVNVGNGRLELTDLREANKLMNSADVQNYRYTSKKLSNGAELYGYEFEGNPLDITGGYIVERDYGDKFDAESCKFVTPLGDHYVLKGPKYASVEEVGYIEERFGELEDKVRRGENIKDIADITSFADKYLIEEFVKNDGAQRTSAFFYKDADKVNPLIYAGPVWDYDKALNSDDSTYPKANRFLSFFTWYGDHTMLFYELLMNSDYFWEEVKKEYAYKFEPMLNELIDEGKTDELIDYIKTDDDMDSTRWDYSPTTGEYERGVINTFLTERKEFFDDLFLKDGYKNLCLVTVKDERSSSDTILGILKGESLGFEIEAHDKGEFLYWYDEDTKREFKEDTVITADTVIAARYKE